MDLWIRSQDKTRLIKVKGITMGVAIVYNEKTKGLDVDKAKFGIFSHSNSREDLGAYATRERCIEILDEIQNLLTPQIPPLFVEENEPSIDFDFTKNASGEIMGGTATITEHQTIVYQMPLE